LDGLRTEKLHEFNPMGSASVDGIPEPTADDRDSSGSARGGGKGRVVCYVLG
jgi:hypothetical protein